MAKKSTKTNPQVAKGPVTAKAKKEFIPDDTPARDMKFPAWLSDFKVQAIIVALLALALNINTFKHEYALDDTIVIVKNEYVHEGFAGIPSILTKDAFDSYYRQFNSSNQLSGGRYRPLSIVSFAVEQQFLGAHPVAGIDTVVAHAGERGHGEQKLLADMHVRHVFNVIWFTLSMVVLLYFLRYIVFKHNAVMAFLAAIIFVIHPIHTGGNSKRKKPRRDTVAAVHLPHFYFCLQIPGAERKVAVGRRTGVLFSGLSVQGVCHIAAGAAAACFLPI